ncbi:hypothetical protein [Rhizobium leguminosarum]|jgi:hypothetical protein|uniref:Uncharacterized protein n=1 Tax=Rhizobium leguminosarum bv. trifolii (strain WSM1325) TaxID=395491 RepID=C6AWB7_RHILS|nr:hypothetical protein [Rhizobium leguminosarum]ACS55955.1 hypothetical protein Rleg_1668 [Rhizobium leguminosarum bv. trifolii WSM1325]MBY2908156.1 hypothetical protein [Rhizobium leguminosarum]MBY2947930.1 hypothetical protein [Rhizobium leguminosarum]MBY2995629.1 hypothetical protein [Rhizobium leguminosarum]MBY3023285.1 hypothetical protein [Rhizobium leguminosarum]
MLLVACNEATGSMLEAMLGWGDGKTSRIYTKMPIARAWHDRLVAGINWDGVGTKLLALTDESAVANG